MADKDPRKTLRRVSTISFAEAFSLVEAARDGDEDRVDALTSHKSKERCNAPDASGFTPLFAACMHGHENVVDLLIARGAEIDRPSHGVSPLMVACEKGHGAIARKLLELGATFGLRPQEGEESCALLEAAGTGLNDVVQMMLDRGADSNLENRYGDTILAKACEFGHLDVARLLISRGGCVNVDPTKELTPLMGAARSGSVPLLQFLVEHQADINAENPEGTTALATACALRQPQCAMFFLNRGSKVNTRNRVTGNTPLLLAAQNNMEDIVDLLLARGADPRAVDNAGQTALHMTTSPAIVKALLRAGTGKNARDNKGQTPLHVAASNVSRETLKILIDAGGDLGAADEEGLTPLMTLCMTDPDTPLIKLMLEKGADPSIKDKDGMTSLDYIRENDGSNDAIAILEKGMMNP